MQTTTHTGQPADLAAVLRRAISCAEAHLETVAWGTDGYQQTDDLIHDLRVQLDEVRA